MRRWLALQRVRWMLRISPRISTATIALGLERLNWRMNAVGGEMPEMLAGLYSVLGPEPVRDLVLRTAEGQHPPATWWDDTAPAATEAEREH